MGIQSGTAARFGRKPTAVPVAGAPPNAAELARQTQLASNLQYAGAATSAIGAIAGVMSQRIALKGAAAIAEINAQVAEQSAQVELSRGQDQVAALTQRAGQVKSAQRASMAANGIDLGEGSAAEVLTSTDMQKEQDMHTASLNAVRAAWGQRTNSTNLMNQANAQRSSADSMSPLVAGASSLLGSAGSIAGSWYSLNKNGANAPSVAPKGT